MNKQDKRVKAISKLLPLGGWSDNGTKVIIHEDGAVHGYTSPTQDEIDAEIVKIEAELISTQYQRDRVAEYPSLADQIGAILKGGAELEVIKTKVQAVKDKYPKGVK